MTENENPFLIPPPPRGGPSEAKPPEAEEPDPAASLISLPPGLVDSATHRLGTRVTRRQDSDEDPVPVRRSLDEVVFFPAPPGGSTTRPEAPPPSDQSAAPAPPPTAPPPTASAPPATARTSWTAEAADATVIRPIGSAASWRLTLPSGDTVELTKTTFVGRNPATTAESPNADLLPVSDPAKSVSKTHALLEVADGRLWVHDLDSTNGVWLVVPGSDATQVRPHERAAVPPGADIELGEFTVQVEHSGH